MAEVRGFRALRYNKEKVGNLDNVITPPFDVISPEEREILAAKSPYNYVHAILPKSRGDMNMYDAAAQDFESWIRQGIINQDDSDSFYLLQQTFRSLDGTTRVRRAFFGVTRIPEPEDADTVLGHERTFDKKVTDRLALTRSTRANLGAVFALYDDPKHELAGFLGQMDSRPEDMLAHTIDGATQQVWRVPADAKVTEFFRDKRLYIADGHHRYRTACIHRDQMRQNGGGEGDQRWNYVLMGYVALDDPGLFVYPAHRVVEIPDGFKKAEFLKSLEPWFEVSPVTDDLPGRVRGEANCAIGVQIEGDAYLLRLRDIDRTELLGTEHGPAWRDLDVSVLHGGILERVLGLGVNAEFIYEKDVETAMDLAKPGTGRMVFVLRNMYPDQVRACAEAREYMPQKATYFFPKLPSGAAIHRLV